MEYITEEIKERLYSLLISYRAELVLMSLSALILICSFVIFVLEARQAKAAVPISTPVTTVEEKPKERFIYVDIAGAVEYPDVYKVVEGTRLKALIGKAGGLSDVADKPEIAKTMNMSSILTDQQKIYMPKVGDQAEVGQETTQTEANSKISINSSGANELTELSGVGEVTAKKIIAGRPYKAISELLSKKIVGKSLYDKIKDFVLL